jgi:pimeloyl-ACP methyl ester carboxylesterase
MIYNLLANSIVWPLRAITPLCFIAFPAGALKLESGDWRRTLLLSYTGAEILFYCWFRRALRISQVRQHPPLTSRERRDEIWEGIRESAPEGENPYSFLRMWFSVSTLAHVSRLDLRQWLAWALFDRQYDEIVSVKAQIELEERIVFGEKELSVTIPDETVTAPGKEEAAAAMRLNVDPVTADHRPLVYYAATAFAGLAGDAALRLRGFRKHRVGPVCFWIVKGSDASGSAGSESEPPLVFVHGVGIGLATYLPFLLRLSSASQRAGRTIVLIELPHVSMKLNVDTIPRMDVIAECAAIFFKQQAVPPALWVAHSLGTFVFAVVNRLQPELVAGAVLVDPVCFLLWEPDLLRNFCYKVPETPMQIIQNYHVCRELSISHFFHRHFWWHECVQFAKQMPAHSLVYISENDGIYNTGRVMDYLKANDVPMHVFEGHQHGGWIMDAAATGLIIESAHMSHLLKREAGGASITPTGHIKT